MKEQEILRVEDLKKYFITIRGEKGDWLRLLLLFVSLGLLGLIVVQLGWWKYVIASYWLISGSTSLVIFIDLVLMPFVIIANEIFFRGLVMTLVARWLGVLWGILGQALHLMFTATTFPIKSMKFMEAVILII